MATRKRTTKKAAPKARDASKRAAVDTDTADTENDAENATQAVSDVKPVWEGGESRQDYLRRRAEWRERHGK